MVYLVVVFLVLLTFFSIWRKIETEASENAVLVATKRMVDQVNRYKQQWLIKGKPSHIVYAGKSLPMTEFGLLDIYRGGEQPDCRYWLFNHYPKQKIYDAKLLHIESQQIKNEYRCRYIYQHDISILMYGNERLVKVMAEKP